MTKLIPLTKGQFAIVDDADFDWLSQWKWYAVRTKPNGKYSATRRDRKAKKTIFMHRLILNAPSHLQVDHIDLDRLNNQRANIRLCTHAQNERNKPKYKGSVPYKGVVQTRAGNYSACISFDGTRIQLGTYSSAIDAAHAYDAAARIHHGEFAYLNFPQEQSL
jgi:hypothetical protein